MFWEKNDVNMRKIFHLFGVYREIPKVIAASQKTALKTYLTKK